MKMHRGTGTEWSGDSLVFLGRIKKIYKVIPYIGYQKTFHCSNKNRLEEPDSIVRSLHILTDDDRGFSEYKIRDSPMFLIDLLVLPC